MQSSQPLPLWAGRTAALLGIVLFALSIRHAIAALSPIISQVSVDIPLSSTAVGVLGMLPPLAFAVFGLVGPSIVRRIGLERALLLSAGLEIVGMVARGLSPNLGFLIGTTTVILIGSGIGNVLMPGLVKRYFPDRIGLMTSVYASLIAVSSAMPPAVAVPLADSAGWRFSVSIWAAFAAIALVPWLVVLARQRRTARALADLSDVDGAVDEVEPSLVGRLWHSRTAVAITLGFALCAMNVYAGYAWLPSIFVDTAGTSRATGGAFLALWSVLGMPISFVIPILVVRLHNILPIYVAGAVFTVAGYLGLLLAPEFSPLLWTFVAGLSPMLFSASLALIAARTRTHDGAVALSGFVQGIGYGIGALGPLIVGFLHDSTHNWTIPLIFIMAVGVASVIPGVLLMKKRFVEDELAERRLAPTA